MWTMSSGWVLTLELWQLGGNAVHSSSQLKCTQADYGITIAVWDQIESTALAIPIYLGPRPLYSWPRQGRQSTKTGVSL
jgi:hypothetical protein